MARFLFTMLPANDLGLPTRLVPIARVLADRGHDVAVFNPAPVPAKLINDAGLKNFPMPSLPMPAPVMDLAQVGSAWDVEEFFAALCLNEESTRGETAVYVDAIRNYGPDVVIDSFGLLTVHHAPYLPGRAMAERCDLIVHHGGHSSVMTGLSVGTPAVIIPTITERESNARRLAALGAGEIVMWMAQTVKSRSMWPISAPKYSAY